MSLEKDLREAVTELAFEDEAAAQVVLLFVRGMTGDTHDQSASSMTFHLGQALMEHEGDPEDSINATPTQQG
jgi:hypothetical protein